MPEQSPAQRPFDSPVPFANPDIVYALRRLIDSDPPDQDTARTLARRLWPDTSSADLEVILGYLPGIRLWWGRQSQPGDTRPQ